MPDSLLSPLGLPERIPAMLEVHLPAQPEPSPEEKLFEQSIREYSSTALEDALNSLRLDGASEQQLGAVMGSTRLECLLRLLELDLDGVVLEHLITQGSSPSLRQVLATALVPELKNIP
jgi:hypothetical protein